MLSGDKWLVLVTLTATPLLTTTNFKYDVEPVVQQSAGARRVKKSKKSKKSKKVRKTSSKSRKSKVNRRK